MNTDQISNTLKESKSQLVKLEGLLGEVFWWEFKKKSFLKQRIAEEKAAIHTLYLLYFSSIDIKLQG